MGGVITEEGSDQVRTILSVNLSLPENEHGMGPYEGCVEIENVETTDVGEAYGRDFYAPGIGEVADWEDEPNLRGHKISDVQFAESDAPTPTPTPTFFSLPTPTATPDPSDHLTDMIDGIPIIDSFHRISTSMSWDDDDNVSTDYLLDQEDQDPIIFVNYGPYVFDGSEPLRYLNMPVISIFNSCGLEIENFFMAIRIFPRSNDNEEHVPDRTFSRSIFGGATRDGTSGVPDDITLSSTSKTIEKRVIDDLDTYIIPLTGVLSANEILIFDLQFDRGEEIHNLIYETAFFGIHTDADVRDPIYTYTMDGSTDEENNLLVIYPEGYQLGNYSYGEFDVSEGEEEYTNGFGLKANLEPGKGVTVFGKPLTVDPETYIFLRISASCSDPRAEIAVGALDAESAEYLEDAKLNGSIGSNLLRVSTRFVNHFEYLETLYLRERTAIVPVFQAVNSSGVGSIQVQFDNLEIYAIPRAQLLTR
ncbi:MAG: hypothetical protein JXR73_12505 [Candidatus Omnitrophica bacterium]|nr:hypothetical protein [Candidatus Omnitrophota bacterium]